MNDRVPLLFVASNGVGMGHVVRCLALARRCPDHVRPVVATFSTALAPIRHFGFPCEHLRGFNGLESDRRAWDAHLETELSALIETYGARAVVFDGNNLYPGLLAAIGRRPACRLIWIRRGMWKVQHGVRHVEQQRYCDAVIEPGDVAERTDVGPTVLADRALPQPLLYRHVEPVTLLDADELLGRAEARRELGIGTEERAVLVQLGAGNISGSYEVVREVVENLRRHASARLFLAEWEIAERSMTLWDDVRCITRFPLARYLKAFDFTIGAAGYNTIHDTVNAALPSLFIPEEHARLDDQLRRASFLAECGAAFVLRATEMKGLPDRIRELGTASIADGMVRRLKALQRDNGAVAAAACIASIAEEFLR